MTQDPQRWLDPDSDASDGLRAVLASASDDADPAQRDRLESRLGAALGWGAAGAATGVGAAAATTAAGKGGVLKIVILAGAALAVTAGGGVLGYQALQTPEPAPVEAPAEPEAPVEAPTREPAPEPLVEEPVEEAVEPPAEEPVVEPAPRRPRSQPTDPGDDLASEVALLGEVQRHVDSDPRRALRLLAQHRQRFPNGTLVEEREFFTAQALWTSGQRRQARVRARRFLARYPRSTHAPRLQRIVDAE